MADLREQFAREIGTIRRIVETALSREAPSSPDSPEEAWIHDPAQSRFATIARVFNLSLPEIRTLHCLLAAHFEPDLAAAYRDASGYEYVHEALVRRIFGLDLAPIYTSESALNLWQLVRVRDLGMGMPLGFGLDLALVEWLAGKSGLEPALQQRLTRVQPAGGTTEWDASALTAAIREPGAQNRAVICEFTGSVRNDYSLAAAQVCAGLGSGLWAVEDGDGPLDAQQIMRIHRFVNVQNAGLYWHTAAHTCLAPALSPSARVQFIANAEEDIALTATRHRYLSAALPNPNFATLRVQLGRRFPEACPEEISLTAAMKGLHRDLIENPDLSSIGALKDRLMSQNTRALRAFAMPLPTDLRFEDLVLSDDLEKRMRGLVSEIQIQHRLWESPEVSRVYAQERALTILLQGPPGTGKTLSAKVLAGEAGLPIFRVDIASLTSKYRGETSKNMRAMFRAANQSGAILFVDEFDAVASRRTEARNEIARADNQDTAYFIQLVENAFEGVVICATNRAMDIDEAMHRRIRHTLDLQLPGVDERAGLWRIALAPFAPSDEVMDFAGLLAGGFEFSGARIKAVVLNAHARAGGGALTVEGLRRATMAEARINGRMPGRRDMERIADFGERAAEGIHG
jgi:AAA+ superfamily predicted ATPase